MPVVPAPLVVVLCSCAGSVGRGLPALICAFLDLLYQCLQAFVFSEAGGDGAVSTDEMMVMTALSTSHVFTAAAIIGVSVDVLHDAKV
ncbi:MAG: hypothetical protein IVW55_07810 [Chloroflexi bacterium]|nr:hypothetical protein [Chloroflexota bacterium]